MRIQFKSPDPRAGTIAQMDSARGRQLVDSGAAIEVKDDGGPVPAPKGKAPNPPVAVGKRSSASPAAPASRRTTAKPSKAGGKKGRRGA